MSIMKSWVIYPKITKDQESKVQSNYNNLNSYWLICITLIISNNIIDNNFLCWRTKEKTYLRKLLSLSIIPLSNKSLSINLFASKLSISASLCSNPSIRSFISFIRDGIDSRFFFSLAASATFTSFSFINK